MVKTETLAGALSCYTVESAVGTGVIKSTQNDGCLTETFLMDSRRGLSFSPYKVVCCETFSSFLIDSWDAVNSSVVETGLCAEENFATVFTGA